VHKKDISSFSLKSKCLLFARRYTRFEGLMTSSFVDATNSESIFEKPTLQVTLPCMSSEVFQYLIPQSPYLNPLPRYENASLVAPSSTLKLLAFLPFDSNFMLQDSIALLALHTKDKGSPKFTIMLLGGANSWYSSRISRKTEIKEILYKSALIYEQKNVPGTTRRVGIMQVANLFIMVGWEGQ